MSIMAGGGRGPVPAGEDKAIIARDVIILFQPRVE